MLSHIWSKSLKVPILLRMSIPHCFDPLIGAKPKHPQVGALSQTAPQPVDEIAPLSQIPGLNLTQFNNIRRVVFCCFVMLENPRMLAAY